MNFIKKGRQTLLTGVPEGYDGAVLVAMSADADLILFVARDDRRMAAVADAIAFFGQDVDCISVPAWDCLPYDRVSPRADILARRVDALTTLSERQTGGARAIVLTTVAAILQRVPPPGQFAGVRLEVSLQAGASRTRITDYLESNNFQRTETVMEPGEYAVRGGILDLFPPGRDAPLRLDFFGDDLDSIRIFDPLSQLTTGEAETFQLEPVGEITLNDNTVERFRIGYRALFGAASDKDILYESVSAGRRYQGMEHWLPLFHEVLGTLFDYLPDAVVVLDHEFEAARLARLEMISDCFEARQSTSARGLTLMDVPYHPLPTDRLYLTEDAWSQSIDGRSVLSLRPFAGPAGAAGIEDAGGKPGRDFADVRARPGENVYDALRGFIDETVAGGRSVILTALSEGSRQRFLKIAGEHGIRATPAPDGPSNYADSDAWLVTGGVGWDASAATTLDAALQWVAHRDRRASKTDPADPVGDYVIGGRVVTVQAGLRHRF